MIRRLLIIAALAVSTPAVLTQSGCAFFQDSHPTQQVRDVGAIYIAVTNTLNTARAAGEIGYDDWHNTINPAIQEGRAIYNDMNAAVIAGDIDQVELLEVALNGVVSRLNLYASNGGN